MNKILLLLSFNVALDQKILAWKQFTSVYNLSKKMNKKV